MLVMVSLNAFAEKKIAICTDNNFWYPFTLVEKGQPKGIHIDIIARALSNIGYTAEFKALPWKRCLKAAETGKMDGIATASYKDARARFLHYPADAKEAGKSPNRVMQVEYIVVTTADSSYQFGGNVKTLPAPVLAPRGYSIADDLKKQGVRVDDSATGDEKNIKKLLRKGKGSVVTIPEVVNVLSRKDAYKGKLHIGDTPIESKSYYLPVSKKSSISEADRNRIWAEIAKIRDNAEVMAEIAAKY
ncbi:MAG: amino acid ABC transporter substrate-binding protein [Proteobacteria bacterium]|nr:MAG: amino acid ABC transporter substrate-binding protein [Pseudomonadota bacterium]PIE40468.1 MAG: amino acid ABC transporter substrate-binding protein [Gammaproteobacteria bacterium]